MGTEIVSTPLVENVAPPPAATKATKAPPADEGEGSYRNDTVTKTGRLARTLRGAGITAAVLADVQAHHMPSAPALRLALDQVLKLCAKSMQGTLEREELLRGPASFGLISAVPDHFFRHPWGRILGCYFTARLALFEDPKLPFPAPGMV